MKIMRLLSSAWLVVGLVTFGVAEYNPIEALKAEGYIKPPQEIQDTVLAPWHKNIEGGALNPDRTMMLVSVSDGMPSISYFAKEHQILGGKAVDTVAIRDRGLTLSNSVGYQVMDVKTGELKNVPVPDGLRVSGGRWSPDGKKIGFVGLTEENTNLYVVEVDSMRVRKVNVPLRLTGVTSFEWLADSERVAVTIEPDPREMPAKTAPANGPVVRTTTPAEERLRTYASLLDNPRDMDLLEEVMTAQLAVINTGNSSVQRIGQPAMYRSVNVAGDGSGAIVNVMERPFSYLVTYSSFPSREYVMGADGKSIHTIRRTGRRGNDDESVEQEQRRGGQGGQASGGNGMRSLAWHPDGDGLVFLQMEPVNREDREAERMDRVMRWKAPYGDDDKEEIFKSKERISSVQFSEDGSILFLSRTVDQKSVIDAVLMSDPSKSYTVRTNPTGDDAFYKNPGSLETKPSPNGGSFVMVSDDQIVYLGGTQYFENPRENAPRPFVDKVKITSGEKTRVFESSETRYQNVRPLDDNFEARLLTSESPTEVEQIYYVPNPGGRETKITNNQDYAPSLTQARTRVIDVTRADGFRFEVTVTLPRYSVTGDDKPAMFWFYPREYEDQESYDRSTRNYNKNTFPSVSSSNTKHLLNLGYVIVNNDCPIVGPSDAPNDRFAHELRMNLSATIDKLAEERLIDRSRLAIGGHSYGAFGTANALIHTPFFKAGIAGAGNYNRSLTPFGFQREPRAIWQTREVYTDVSAMWHADKMNGALLMYHGMQDQNMGTDPQHSRRMFQALEALGKKASLYMYPYEDHGQRALETRLDMWARWVAWLDMYVKNPGKYEEEDEDNGGSDGGDDGNGDGVSVMTTL